MDFFENPYYRIYRFSLTSVALWPYQNARFTVLWRILICCILITCFVMQVLKIFTKSRCNMDMVLGTMGTIGVILGSLVKYLGCWIFLNNIKDLLNRIKEEWCTTLPKSEMEIIHEYAERGRVFTTFYMSVGYTWALLISLRFLLPEILNVYTPFNISRFMYEPAIGEYFVDVDEYFFFIALHISVGAIIIVATIVATDTLFIALMFHACAMFSVVGYRLQHGFDKDAPDSCAIDKSRKAVVRILDHHKRTIEFVRIMTSSCEYSYLILLFLIIMNLSCLMFHLNNVLMKMDDIDEIFLTVGSIVIHCGFVFLNCFPGQKLLDSSSDVFHKAYSGLWYTASSKSKKILLLIMVRTMQPAALNSANIFTISFEMFGTIIHSSMSYFMVLYTIQSQAT